MAFSYCILYYNGTYENTGFPLSLFGPALVHMINNFMTRPRAAEAIRLLIRDKKYGSVTPRELWRTYDVKAVGLPADMGTIMGSWTDQAGYPLVTAIVDQADGSVTLHQEYLKELVSPVYDSFGLYLRSSDSQLQQLNRVQIVGLACSLGLPACVQTAQHQEQLISQGKSSQVAPGLESIQLCTVLEAGVSAGDILHQLTTWSPEDQLRAMPCSHDKQLLARYLTKSLHEDTATDWSAKLTAAVSRTANINTAFSLILSHYKTLLTRFGATNVAAYFKQVGNLLSTKSQLTKMESLQSVIVEEEITSAVKTVTTGLLDRLQWAEKNTPTIESWLVSFHKECRRNERPGSLVYCV